MNIKIGDKVRFLNEIGEGLVTNIINKTTVGVTVEDGFELPFLISQLVLISDKQPHKETIKPVKLETAQFSAKASSFYKKIEKGIYIALTLENKNDSTVSDFNLWMINQTDYSITFSFSILDAEGYKTLCVSSLQPFQKQLIETITRKNVDDYNNIKIDALFHNEKVHQYQAPISESIKLKSIKLYKENAFVDNDFIAEKAFVILVFDLNSEIKEDSREINSSNNEIDFSKFLFQKQTHNDAPQKSKPNNNKNELEIDLHIEELLDDYSCMNNGQIIQVQLNHLQKAINKAIANRYKKLIVIHGIGNGRLKQEVRSVLSLQNMQYFDGKYSQYGYGATEVIIGG